MKAFLLMSAAWLSGAGGDPAPLPVTGPVVAQAPAGPCCGNNLPAAGVQYAAPAYGVPYTGQAVPSTVVPGAVTGGCACDPCANCAPVNPCCNPCGQTAAPAAPAAGPGGGAAPAGAGGAGAPKHLFHRLFGAKKTAGGGGHPLFGGGHPLFGGGGGGGGFTPVTTAPAAAAPAAGQPATSCGGCPQPAPCGCNAPVVGGQCGCGATSVAAPAPAQAPAQNGGMFSRFFGGRPAPAAAPVSTGTVISGAPGCSGCANGGYQYTGAPATAVISGTPSYQPSYHPSYPQVLPGTALPHSGTPIVTPGTGMPIIGTPVPMGGQPLPMGTTPPEGIKEAPKEPMKLPGGDNKNLQPTSGTRLESEGRNPFDQHHRQQAQAGSAADYSWVTGRLSYVHVDGGLWVLRYAPLDKEDRYGGSVVLMQDRRLENYREGDIITVKGEILAAKASTRLAAPLYRLNTIQLVERPTSN